MGIVGGSGTQQKKKKKPASLDSSRMKETLGHEERQWGSLKSMAKDGSHGHGDAPSQVPLDSPDLSHNLISPFIPDTTTSSASHSPPSYHYASSSLDGSSHGKASCHRAGHGKNDSNESFSSIPMKDDAFHFSRWDSSRFSAEQPSGGKNACNCAAGLTGDLAAVCCCPFSVLHLFVIAFIKVPTTLVSKSLTRLKRTVRGKWKKTSASREDDVDSVVASSSYPLSRTRSDEGSEVQAWGPALAFSEQRLWRNYFDSPDAGEWSANDPAKSKS